MVDLAGPSASFLGGTAGFNLGFPSLISQGIGAVTQLALDPGFRGAVGLGGGGGTPAVGLATRPGSLSSLVSSFLGFGDNGNGIACMPRQTGTALSEPNSSLYHPDGRRKTVIRSINPCTGKGDEWRSRGSCLVWSGDVSAERRLSKARSKLGVRKRR